jgi:sec-independent protein translocase protein TatA
MFDLSPIQLIIVLVIAVLVLGPSRLPQFSRAVGKGLRDFKGALGGEHFDDDPPPTPKAQAAEPPAPATATAAAAQPVTTATAGPAEPAGTSTDVLEGIVVSGDAPPTAPPAADK